jgi:hypothetical protein
MTRISICVVGSEFGGGKRFLKLQKWSIFFFIAMYHIQIKLEGVCEWPKSFMLELVASEVQKRQVIYSKSLSKLAPVSGFLALGSDLFIQLMQPWRILTTSKLDKGNEYLEQFISPH